MFKRDPTGRFFPTENKEGPFLEKKIVRRWWFFSGDDCVKNGMLDNDYEQTRAAQHSRPVIVMQDPSRGKRWWMFQGEFFIENEGLSADEVKVRALKGQQRRRNAAERAAVLTTQQMGGGRPRQSIPRDVKVFVWQRDGGQCCECGSRESLEFDHIIPVSMGGGSTARNLQLLCEDCNRTKGGEL